MNKTSCIKKVLSVFILSLTFPIAWAQEETEMTTAEAMGYYQNTSKQWITCHDPNLNFLFQGAFALSAKTQNAR